MKARPTILVSDSDACVRTLFVDILEEEGYLVRTLHPATFPNIRISGADLVILDLLYATADASIFLIDRLRNDEVTRQIPILISCTDGRLLDALAEPLRHLRCRTLLKPFAIKELLELIDQAVGHPALQSRGLYGCVENAVSIGR